MKQPLNLYGFASGIAANNPDCGLGPLYLYYHPEIFKTLPFDVEWKDLLMATSEARGAEVMPELVEISTLLAQDTAKAVAAQEDFCVLGGDHSCAIGTWAGVMNSLKPQETLGLIWIDAHLDSHTPETSDTQNIHGMPVSHLLGQGFPELAILLEKQTLKPENVCLIGVRSYEAGEAQYLQNLNVKIFMIEEIRERGIKPVLEEALAHIRQASHIGLSIDLDAFDPHDAPGVGCREAGGIDAKNFLAAVQGFSEVAGFVGLEIGEYNPLLDEKAKTAYLIRDLIQAVFT